jgi:Flp pilus assembly protein CpaB
MAEEERTGVQNIWLLIIAVALGVVVVVIYNVHINRVRQEGRGQTIGLLRLTRDIDPGDKIKEDDLVVVRVPKQYEANLGNVIPAEQQSYAVGSVVNQKLLKDQYLLWSHTTTSTGGGSNPVTQGNVGLAVSVDSTKAPGDILMPNDLVNIVAHVSEVGGSAMKTYRIIEGVRVLAIAGAGLPSAKMDPRMTKPQTGSRSYRTITVELPKDLSLEFSNVLSYVNGYPWVEILPPNSIDRTYRRINPLLKNMAALPNKPLKAEDDRN